MCTSKDTTALQSTTEELNLADSREQVNNKPELLLSSLMKEFMITQTREVLPYRDSSNNKVLADLLKPNFSKVQGKERQQLIQEEVW